MMTHGSLFSGIGGFDLAADWMGWENVFHCEWNTFGQRVLKHYWPQSISHENIITTDFNIYRGRIDILSGGFPCQPYSQAGKRLGKEDERHLWPEMLRAIREIRPSWVVGENVLGLVNWSGGLVFHEVQVDLEAEGYEVQSYVLPACAVNAPHRRDRVWIVAHSKNIRCDIRQTSNGWEKQEFENRNGVRDFLITDGESGITSDTESGRQRGLRNESKEAGTRKGDQSLGGVHRVSYASDTGNEGLQGGEINGSIGGIRQNGNQFFAGCLPSTWEKFPTQSPICNGDDGLSSRLDGISFPKWRNESIKAGGNAIVPQVVHQIFQSIQEYENLHLK